MKKRVFSGIQPTGELHIGNYLGAIKNWVRLQSGYDCVFSIVDYHAITVPYDPGNFRKHVWDITATLLAAGIDPKKCILFVQSHVSEHTELAWILSSLTPIGELERMTQYKEKRILRKEGPNAGLLAYPILQAADILLFKTHLVPVGKDQEQHIELTRSIARKFNASYKTRFILPAALIPKFGAKILSLQNPEKKMSKTGDEAISLTDPPRAIRDKIKRAVTDSGREVRYDPETKPAISNLMTLYHLFGDFTIPNIEKRYAGKGYSEFKADLAEVIIHALQSFHKRRGEIICQPNQMKRVLNDGAQRARKIASRTLAEVKEKMGLLLG